MDVAHILLGCPWLYNLNIKLHGRNNTYSFRYQNNSLTLNPCRPKELLPSPCPKASPTLFAPISVSTPSIGTIFLLHHRTFDRLRISKKFYLTIFARELTPYSISSPRPPTCVRPSMGFPDENNELLKEFVDIDPNELPGELPPLGDT